MNKQKTYTVASYRLSLVRERTVGVDGALCGTPRDAAAVLNALLYDSVVERIYVIYLDGRNRVKGAEQVSQGGLHGSHIHPRDIFRGAIVIGASAVMLGHNHPGGDPKPSMEDIELTKAAVATGEAVGISVMDHVIVTPSGAFWSMYEHEQMGGK